MKPVNTLRRVVKDADTLPLSRWIEQYSRSENYERLVRRIAADQEKAVATAGNSAILTSYRESAMIYALIQHLRPTECLEIGTFFASTTRIMAEAIVEGKTGTILTTIDPFGKDRVPAIIEAWPKSLQSVTQYRPCNSMEYFLELETKRVPKGCESPLGIAFVDGHHNFEYALYDIVRSADHVKPGGAIVVDNMEQPGPRAAALRFLEWNSGWRLFYDGMIYGGDKSSKASANHILTTPTVAWGVLLSPNGIQVASQDSKLNKLCLTYKPLNALRFNIVEASHPGTLHANFLYYAMPHDYHITGKGIVYQRVVQECDIKEADSAATMEFPLEVQLDFSADSMNLFYELELRYDTNMNNGYLLLDAGEPVTLA